MAVKYTVVTTKTADKQWWEDANRELAMQQGQYNRNFPGLITVAVTKNEDNSPDVLTTTMIFSDGIALAKYFLQAFANEINMSRRKYNYENGITNEATIEEI